MPLLGPGCWARTLGQGNRDSVAAYVEGEWVAGDSYNLQNERGTTFVFTVIDGVLQVA